MFFYANIMLDKIFRLDQLYILKKIIIYCNNYDDFSKIINIEIKYRNLKQQKNPFLYKKNQFKMFIKIK